MKKWLFLIAALPLIFFSCRKDVNEITVTGTEYKPPVVVVTGHLTGLVVGPSSQPMANAIVRVGAKATTTDENGFFQFRNIEMNSRGTYVTVNRDGFFPGSTRLFPQNGSTNYTKIELLPKTVVGSIPGNAGGSVDVSGATISLPANGVVDAMNNTYEGDVQVAAHWLNPTARNLNDIMPGGLQGVNKENREVGMATFGMMAVELQDANGNELQVAPGRKAELTFPVPAELQGNAPAEIPLWSFDEEVGLWIEEGSATLQGNVYVGEVSHFSFWNIDWPTEVIYLTGTVVNDSGDPVANQLVSLTLTDLGLTGYGYTNEDGVFATLAPADEPILVEVSGFCGDLLSTTIGPFTEDTDAGTFTVTDPDAFSISGQLNDCDGAAVAGGIVSLQYSDYNTIVVADENGSFSTTILTCDAVDVEVIAYDLNNALQTDAATYNMSSDLDLGPLSVCDQVIEEFFNITVDGNTTFFIDPDLAVDDYEFSPDSITWQTYSTMRALNTTSDTLEAAVTMYLGGLDVGTYSGSDLGMDFNYTNFGGPIIITYYLSCWIPCNDMTVTITANGGSGGYLEGTFTGTMEGWGQQQQQVTLPVSGAFRIEIP